MSKMKITLDAFGYRIWQVTERASIHEHLSYDMAGEEFEVHFKITTSSAENKSFSNVVNLFRSSADLKVYGPFEHWNEARMEIAKLERQYPIVVLVSKLENFES